MKLKVMVRVCVWAVLLTGGIPLFAQDPASEAARDLVVKSIQVRGNTSTDSSLIVATSRLAPGDVVTAMEVQEGVKKLYGLGIFSDVRVISAGQDDTGLDLIIEVAEYPVVEELTIEGNKEIELKKIQTEIKLIKGQVVSPQDVKKAQDVILGLYRDKGYYLATVDIKQRKIEKEDKVILTFTIKEGKKIKIRKITMAGNQNIAAKKLLGVIQTKEKRWWRKSEFKSDTLDVDKERIVAHYLRNGYRDAKVTDYTIDYDSTKENMFITFNIVEGPLYRMGTLTWAGDSIYTPEQLAAVYELKAGAVFNMEKYQRSTAAIYMLYQEKGYIYASIVPTETVDSTTVNITYTIKEGIPAVVNKIAIKGNVKTKEKVIRRELMLKPGETFRRSALDRSQREIYQLNFFQNVEIDYNELSEGKIDVVFNVEEKSSGRASLGAGYGTDGLVGTVGLATPNLAGNGQNLDFNWEFGTQNNNTFQVSFTEPWLFDTPTSAGVSLYNLTRDQNVYYYRNKTGVSFNIGRTRIENWDYFKVYAKYGVNVMTIDTFNTVDDKKESKYVWESSIGLTVMRDSRDLPEFANSGSNNSYFIKLAGGFLLGDENYHKHILTFQHYFPTFWKLVLNPALTLGYLEGWGAGNHRDVPDYELFRPGGRSLDGQVRGYDDYRVTDTLGTNSSGALRVGGRILSVFNLEYRFPIVDKTFYGLLFFDAGYAWADWDKINVYDMKHGAGFGFRLTVPMLGTLGFDFGYGIDKPDNGSTAWDRFMDKWQPYFQFGKQF